MPLNLSYPETNVSRELTKTGKGRTRASGSSLQPKLRPQRLPKPPNRLRHQIARRGGESRAEEHAVSLAGVFPRVDVGLGRPFRTEETPLDQKHAFGDAGLENVLFDFEEGFRAGLVVGVEGVVDLDPVLFSSP